MEIGIIFSAILSLIAFIIFIKMAINVGHIKEVLDSPPNKGLLKAEYFAHYAKGNKEAAHHTLLMLVFSDATEKNHSLKERNYLFENGKKKYKPFFDKLGFDYPENPFVD
jgi:hypothetical protein